MKIGLNATHRRWLLELTSLPTAAGCEGRVIAWIKRWARGRRSVSLQSDRAGNLMIRRTGRTTGKPIILAAHMDHPAFVLTEKLSPRRWRAEFRGGVEDKYFVGSPVRVMPARGPAEGGIVRDMAVETHPKTGRRQRLVVVEMERESAAQVGDIATWALPPARVKGNRLYAPVCDDLAGVAAALAAFDALGRARVRTDVRVLLTRAEEIGFVGAMAACELATMPRGSRIIALENSRSYPESPIGAGPIVRVGDRTSIFDPELTYRVNHLAEDLAQVEATTFRAQRKLMPGGTCEATAYQALGYAATCVCLPLGRYHNMNFDTGKIDLEMIDLADFTHLVQLLVEVGRKLDARDGVGRLREQLRELYRAQRGVLRGAMR